MKNLFQWALVLPIIASISITGCSKADDVIVPPTVPTVPTSPVDGKTLLFMEDNDVANITVAVYADAPLTVGYNKLYLVNYEIGTTNMLSDGHVTFEPMMHMVSGMMHTCPVENPTTSTPTDGLYEGAAVFIMPSGSSTGEWDLGVKVHNHANGEHAHIVSRVQVASPAVSRMYSFEDLADGTGVFVSLVQPEDADVGSNDFEVTVHRRVTMMDFQPITDFMVEIEPEMPSMGHGSPSNVNPTHTGTGHYLGTVNFTMPGSWVVNMTIKDAGGLVKDDSHAFDFEL